MNVKNVDDNDDVDDDDGGDVESVWVCVMMMTTLERKRGEEGAEGKFLRVVPGGNRADEADGGDCRSTRPARQGTRMPTRR